MNNRKSAFTVCVLLLAALGPAGKAQTNAAGTSAPDYLTGLTRRTNSA
jgi:hypothetical protein